VFNACFTSRHARALSEVIDYSVGAERAIGDKVAVTFAGAFYRALSFGESVRNAFESAKAELALTKIPRSRGIELFVRDGISETEPFPHTTVNQSYPHLSTGRDLLLNVARSLDSKSNCLEHPANSID
jgi:hypothetical protein